MFQKPVHDNQKHTPQVPEMFMKTCYSECCLDYYGYKNSVKVNKV